VFFQKEEMATTKKLGRQFESGEGKEKKGKTLALIFLIERASRGGILIMERNDLLYHKSKESGSEP